MTSRARVVLDSNTLVSGLYRAGYSRTVLLKAIHDGEITMIISPFILSEVQKALLKKLKWSSDRVDEVLSEFSQAAIVVNPSPTLSMLRHAGDNRVLECAIEGSAQYIVTGDHEFLRLNHYEGIAILSARQFLDVLGGL